MKYVSSTFKLFWFVICFSGNIYQIGQISGQFFKYEIITTISVNFPEKFTAPAINICFFEVELVDWDKLISVNPNIKEELNMSLLSNEEVIRKVKLIPFHPKRKFQGIMFDGWNIKQRSQIVTTFGELFSYCLLTDSEDGINMM